MHRFLLEQAELSTPGVIRIQGEEARHAVRVRRLREGEAVQVLNGRGTAADASVLAMDPKGRWVDIQGDQGVRIEPARPRLEVCCPPPKGDRLGQLIDTLSQVGAASWRPLRCDRGSKTPPPNKIERLARVAGEAAKQCGRAWVLRIEPETDFDAALLPEQGGRVIVGDSSGSDAGATGGAPVRLLIGPEGGWTPGELERARAAGATIARFGVHTMRIETAALGAAAILLSNATIPGDPRNTQAEAHP